MDQKKQQQARKSSSFTIRASKSSTSVEGKRTILGRFVDPPSKLPTFYTRDGGDDEWKMKANTFQGSVAQWVIDKNALSDDPRRRATYTGAPDGCLTGKNPSNYFILIKEKGDFVAVPVDEWVTFRQSNRRGLDLEEAEAAMKHRRLEAEKQDPISLREAQLVGVSDAEKGLKKNEKAYAEEEPDSDEEWKDVRSSAWKTRPRPRAVDDDDMDEKKQATALDFKDEYKPEDAEDWEHEMAADDDDLDMGDDVNEEEEEERPVGPSPSISGDDGEVSDGGMGDSSVRQKMKRVLRENTTRGSDEESSELLSGDDDDEDDDDVDALDAMASNDLPVSTLPKEEKEPEAVNDDGARKRPRAEELQGTLQLGVPSEEEIRGLLEKEKRMLLADIAAVFKKRLKTADDRKLFTIRVKAVAMLDPQAEGGKRYLILR